MQWIKLQGSRVQGLGLREANMEVEASGKMSLSLLNRSSIRLLGAAVLPFRVL